MNKVVRLKDNTIHILQSDDDVINLIEEYMGYDFSRLIVKAKEDLEENNSTYDTCEYCDAVE